MWKEMKKMNKKIVLSCALLICILALSGIVYLSFSWSGNLEDQPRGFEAEKPYSYLVTTNGTYTVAYNSSGFEEFGGTDADDIINWAFGNLTGGRSWIEKVVLVGNFVIDDAIVIESNSHFCLMGKISLADNSDCNMIENKNPGTYDKNVIIEGGWLNGNGNNQASGNGIYWKQTTDRPAGKDSAVRIRNILITSCKENGVYLHQIGGYNYPIIFYLSAIRCDWHLGYGLKMGNCADASIVNCLFGSSGSVGAWINGGTVLMSDVYFNGQLILRESSGIRLSNFFIDIYGRDVDGLCLQGCRGSNFVNGEIHSGGTNGYTSKMGILLSKTGTILPS